MIYYIHSRMWMLNSSLLPGTADKLKDPRTVELLRLGLDLFFERDDCIRISAGRLIQKEIVPKESEWYGIYPTIDVTFDRKAITTINKRLFNDAQYSQLQKVLFRFTDYGFLNILAIFAVRPEADFSDLEARGELDIAWRLTKLVEHCVDTKETRFGIIKYLEDESLIKKSPDYNFGVPRYLDRPELIKWTDTYLFAPHIFLVNESQSIQDHIKDIFPVKAEHDYFASTYGTRVLFTERVVVWVNAKNLTLEDFLDILVADNLYLAEDTCYWACSNCYLAILEDLADSKAPKNFFSRIVNRKTSKKKEVLSSKDLRSLLIKNNVTLQKIIGIHKSIETEQLSYLNAYVEFSPLTENYRSYRDNEELLKFAVHDKEEEERSNASAVIESILFFFTGLTLFSVFVDISSFLKHEGDIQYDLNLHSMKMRLILAITTIVVLIYIRLYMYRRGR